jgi:acyl carrier protein
MELEQIESVVAEAIISNSEGQLSEINPEVNLRELGLNSINFIKLVVYLEGTFEIEFEEEFLEMDVFENIRHIAQYIKERIDQKNEE